MDRRHQKPLSAVRRKLRGVEHLQCPAYQSPFAAPSDEDQVGGLTASIRTRSDMDYARQLIGAAASEGDPDFWRPDGWCEIPQVDLYVSSNTYRALIGLNCIGDSLMNLYYPPQDRMWMKTYTLLRRRSRRYRTDTLSTTLQAYARILSADSMARGMI